MHHCFDLILNILIQQYFASPNCLMVISDSENSKLNLPLGVLMVNIDISCNMSTIADKIFRNFGCDNFILNVDNPSTIFMAIENELPKYSETMHDRKYIIFCHNTTLKAFEIFEMKPIDFLANIVLVCPDELDVSHDFLAFSHDDVVLTFWTHRYSGLQNQNIPYLLDKWFCHNVSFIFERNLFYDKIRNQNGRRISVGVFDYRPFVIVDEEGAEVIISGAEIRLIKTAVNYMNATMDIFLQNDMWGNVLENGTGFGLRGNVYNDNLDIGAAGLFMTEMAMKQFGLTTAYLRSEITCLVPAPRFAPLWLSPYYSFRMSTWIGLGVTYTLLGVTVYLINNYKIFEHKRELRKLTFKFLLIQKTFAAVIKPLLSQPVSLKEYYFRFMLVLVLLASMTLCVAYNAGFASVLTKPTYENTIDTIEDFLNSDIHWGGVQVADWILSWKYGEEGKYKKAAERYIETTSEHLRELSKQGNVALKIERISGQHHIDPYIQEDIINNYRVMKDYIHTQYVVLILRKHSILLPVMNRIIDRLMQSGIIEFWTQESAGHRDFAIQKKLQYLNSKGNQELIMLKMSHLIGAFVIFLVGQLIALVVFLIEWLVELQE